MPKPTQLQPSWGCSPQKPGRKDLSEDHRRLMLKKCSLFLVGLFFSSELAVPIRWPKYWGLKTVEMYSLTGQKSDLPRLWDTLSPASSSCWWLWLFLNLWPHHSGLRFLCHVALPSSWVISFYLTLVRTSSWELGPLRKSGIISPQTLNLNYICKDPFPPKVDIHRS